MSEVPKTADNWKSPENEAVCDAADTLRQGIANSAEESGVDWGIGVGVGCKDNQWHVAIRVVEKYRLQNILHRHSSQTCLLILNM